MMQAATTTYLKFIEFFQLTSWSSYSLLGKNLIYSQKYPFEKIGCFLKRNKEQVSVQDNVIYKRATIRINGQGISLRDEEFGKNIGTKNQFCIHKGQFLLSKIDARNGAFGVVPEELENGIITGNFWTFDVDYSQINPYYLMLLTRTKKFQELCQTASVGTTNRNYLQENLFLNFEIPLPSLPEQEAIVANYYSKIKEAEELVRQAEDLEDEIERYIFKELDLDDIKEKIYSNKLKIINSSEITRWGVDYISGINSAQFLKSKKFKNEILKNIVQINPSTTLPKQVLPISFVPMECISDEYGEVIELREKQTNEAKGYTKFIEGDLLWARITPCMQNGKSAIVKNLKNNFGCGSTEFHVIRNTSSEIELEYIYQILRLKTVLSHARSHFTGSAGQQRVPKSFLEELMIPIPPYSIQKAISDEINKMKAIKKQSQLKAALLKEEAQQEFENAIFEL